MSTEHQSASLKYANGGIETPFLSGFRLITGNDLTYAPPTNISELVLPCQTSVKGFNHDKEDIFGCSSAKDKVYLSVRFLFHASMPKSSEISLIGRV